MGVAARARCASIQGWWGANSRLRVLAAERRLMRAEHDHLVGLLNATATAEEHGHVEITWANAGGNLVVEKRTSGGGWEAIDHATRRVEPVDAPENGGDAGERSRAPSRSSRRRAASSRRCRR